MVNLKSIRLTRAEGRHDECITETAASYTAASDVLARWAVTAPAKGGYHKCDLAVEFTDGEIFELRVDLEHQHTEGYDVAAHGRQFLKYLAGSGKPAHLTEKQYQDAIKAGGEERKKQARKALDTYDWTSPVKPAKEIKPVSRKAHIEFRFGNFDFAAKVPPEEAKVDLQEICN